MAPCCTICGKLCLWHRVIRYVGSCVYGTVLYDMWEAVFMAPCCTTCGKYVPAVRRKILCRVICSSGMLITDVSGQPVGPVFKGRATGPAWPLKINFTPWRKPETSQDVSIFIFRLNPECVVL